MTQIRNSDPCHPCLSVAVLVFVCCEADISVDALGGDAGAAGADACPVASPLRLFDLNVWYLGNNLSIHAARIEVSIHVRRQFQFDIAINAVERNAISIELLQANNHAAVDSLERRPSYSASDLDRKSTRLNSSH